MTKDDYRFVESKRTKHFHKRGVTGISTNIIKYASIMLLLLSTPPHQRAASRVQHPNHVAASSGGGGGKERLHFVGIRPEVQARKGGW